MSVIDSNVALIKLLDDNQNEKNVLANLKHDHVIAFFGTYPSAKNLIMVTEYFKV